MKRLLLLLLPATLAAQQAPPYETTRIAEGVWQFRWRSHNAFVVATGDGVIAVDPISVDAAAQLGAEIRRLAPDQPLRAVVYSHHHADHGTGADVLRRALDAPRAPVIAHHLAAEAIAAAPAEGQPPPDLTFSDRVTLHFGARPVELHYLGPNHSDNTIVAYVPDARVAFAVDFVSHDRVGYRDLGSVIFPDQLTAIERLLAIPFETIVFGHGPPGDRAAVERQLGYYRDLRSAVEAAVRRGLSEDEAAAQVRLPQYADWGGYEEWFPLNVRGVYRWLAREGR